jgi:hypothetical protein
LEKLGEEIYLKSLDNSIVGRLFETIGNIDGKADSQEAFIRGLAENRHVLQNIHVLTALMSSSLGKFLTEANLEKLGRKVNITLYFFEKLKKLEKLEKLENLE